jgi:taurine transport system permease protein
MVSVSNRQRFQLPQQVWPAIGVAGFLALWQGLATILGPYRLPSPVSLWPDVLVDLHSNFVLEYQGGGSHGIWPHLLYTIQETVIGSAAGISIGVGMGLAMTRWRLFGSLMEVPIELLRTVPPLAAIPFALLWFGPTRGAQTAIVVYFTATMLTITTLTAAANVNPLYKRFAQTLGATENRIFRNVILPAILPEITGGIRVAVGVAWGTEIVSELAGAPMGMGQVFIKMVTFNQLDVIIIGIFWVAVAASLLDLVIVLTLRYINRWMP